MLCSQGTSYTSSKISQVKSVILLFWINLSISYQWKGFAESNPFIWLLIGASLKTQLRHSSLVLLSFQNKLDQILELNMGLNMGTKHNKGSLF